MTSLSPLAYNSSALWIPARGSFAPRVLAVRSLSGDPLADVCRAVFQRCASRFALCEEGHRVAIDQLDLAEIERQRAPSFLALDEASELREILRFDAATQHETYTLSLLRPLNPQHWDIAALVAAPLVPSRPARPPGRKPIHPSCKAMGTPSPSY